MYLSFPAYEEINESQMGPLQMHTSVKSNTSCLEAPPVPWRVKQRQQSKGKSNITVVPGVSHVKDGAATNTDSEYEYISNPVKKENKSTIHKLSKKAGGMWLSDQDGERNSIFYENYRQVCPNKVKGENNGPKKLITGTVEPASLNHEYQQSDGSVESSRVLEESSHQDCSLDDGEEDSDGYLKPIRQTM